MAGIQLVAAIFAAAMLYQVYLNFRRSDLSVTGFLFWVALWIGLLAVTIFPGFFQRLISVAHVARLLDLVTILGLLALTAVAYQLSVAVRRLEAVGSSGPAGCPR